MSILITIISLIVGLIVLFLIIALFMKKEYTIVREININQLSSSVFDYIKYIKNQDLYSVWNQLDPTMKKTYSGTDGTVGFMYAWDSNNKKAGKGEQEITSIKDGKSVEMALHFMKPFEGRSTAVMATTPVSGNQTNVQWSINGKMNYPMNAMLLFMNMEKMIGGDLEGGLANLKKILERPKV